jgi:hypothetical protein
MGPGKYENVGKSQPVLLMIDPTIFTRTRRLRPARRCCDMQEIVFCSSDQNEAEFWDYFGEMPWKAIPFGDRRKDLLRCAHAARSTGTAPPHLLLLLLRSSLKGGR